jgi:hypothetical protein
MTLKEKIEYEDYDKVYAKFGLISEVQKIADDYAIEFAEWVGINYFVYNTWEESKSMRELLEIYKKEKGL